MSFEEIAAVRIWIDLSMSALPLFSLTSWAFIGLSIFAIRCLIRSWPNKSQHSSFIIQAILLLIPPLLFILQLLWRGLLDPFIFYPPWTDGLRTLHKVLVLSWIPVLGYLLFVKRPSIFFVSGPGIGISAIVLILIPLSLCEIIFASIIMPGIRYNWTIQTESPDKLKETFLSMRRGWLDNNYNLCVRPRGALLPSINAYSRKLPPDCIDFSKEEAQRALHWSADSRFLWIDSPDCFFAYDLISKRILRREEFLETVNVKLTTETKR